MCIEHSRLVEKLTSEKDKERQTRLELLEMETTKRIEQLQRQHSDTINSLNQGTTDFIIHYHCLIIIIRQLYTKTTWRICYCKTVQVQMVLSTFSFHSPGGDNIACVIMHSAHRITE